MRKSVLVLVGAAVAVVIIGFVLSRRNDSNRPSVEPVANADSGTHPGDAGKSNSRPQFQHKTPTHTYPQPSTTNSGLTTSPPAPNVLTNWEEKLDAILTSDKP